MKSISLRSYLILTVFLLSGLPWAVNSQVLFSVETMDTQISLEDDGILWTTTLTLTPNQDVSSNFDLVFPLILDGVSTFINATPVPTRVVSGDGKTTITITPIKIIEKVAEIRIDANLLADTSSTEDGTQLFRYVIGLNYAVSSVNVSITLPKFSSVVSDGNQLNVFPSDYEISTDGQRTTVSWLDVFLPESSIRTVIVEYEVPALTSTDSPSNSSLDFILGFVLGIGLLIFGLTIWLLYTRTPPRKLISLLSMSDDEGVKIKTVVRPIILKPHQRSILEILGENDNGITQNDLVLLLGLSKSRVSQHLKELEELDIIVKEKVGRQNMIYLNTEIELD